MAAISVIMPTFNRAAFLVEALGSVLAQTCPVHEIIVWDDGSTDGTREAVAGLSGTSVPVRYFHGPNAGKSRALNQAMTETSGTHVWICDDDDLCRPDATERMLAEMTRSDVPVVGGRYARFGTDPETSQPVDPHPGYWPELDTGSLLRHLLEDIFIFQNATLATRGVYDRVGPFREDLPRSIDYDMIVRLAARFPMGFVDAVLFDQRKHAGARGPAAAKHKARDMDAVWRETDRQIFRDFREVLPLSLYAAMFEAETPGLAARAGLLQRAAVHARHDLWEFALEDFKTVAGMTDAGPFTATEHAICRRAMAGKHGCDGALVPEVSKALVALKNRGAVGQGIALGLARGLRWRLREAQKAGRFGRLAALAGLMLRLAGPGALRSSTPAETGALAERNTLPSAAYEW